ncbi:MAG TPA: UDP-N-acetylglucosamine 2-epimerase (non-hydrolyzing) [Thermoanaerobaculia bacterium]|jgi:UDP-N-acetylglucosamine 2-epimerase (non-hydrolysing)|nr:UDP-N-acetylglucosamine 2-epimerase (non-hydrolyzing) [Thermoanaerobaculia bacterium]
MKVMTWLGTRPEIIRLSRVIPHLDRSAEHVVVHTGQNYDENLSDVFFREMQIRQPDVHLGIEASSFGAQAAQVIEKSFDFFTRERPDRVVILGDTNSGLAAVSAARLGIPVFHMEAGNRCFDDRVPEEINRRIIDNCSDVLMPYTHRSKENLLAEGFERKRIAVTGNPIFEVLQFYRPQIDTSDVMARLSVAPQSFFLATLHRAENVDGEERLRGFVTALDRVAETHGLPMLISLHPRTLDRLQHFGIDLGPHIRVMKPLGFFDFVRLEIEAACVLSDSGTVQEECCIFGVPNVTLRDVTERAETIECGSNILTGGDGAAIESAVAIALMKSPWTPPAEYLVPNVSQTVAKIVMSYGI